jgi:hypothetical protein
MTEQFRMFMWHQSEYGRHGLYKTVGADIYGHVWRSVDFPVHSATVETANPVQRTVANGREWIAVDNTLLRPTGRIVVNG